MKKNFSRGSAESMKDAFERRLAELGGNAVESSMYVHTQEVKGEQYVQVKSGETSKFIDAFCDKLGKKLEVSNIYDGITFKFDDVENIIVLTLICENKVEEIEIPLTDLTMDSDFVEDDVEAIFNEIEGKMDRYEEVKSKRVMDSNGFQTDYTLYKDTHTGEYVTVFGDKDLYGPEDDWHDAEFETLEEALEWFEDFEGIYEDSDDEF